MLDDHGLDKVVNLWLPSDGVIRIQTPQEARTKAHGQVVRLHHVFIAVLGHAGENTHTWFSQPMSRFKSHTEGGSSLLVEEGEKVAHHDDEGPREGGNNRLDLGRFLCVVVDF